MYEEVMEMVFGDRLAQIRRETGMNQKEFAESIGVESSKYNKWENGKNSPDFATVCRLAEHFNTTTDYLLGRTNARNSENKAIMDDLGLSEKSIDAILSNNLDGFGNFPDEKDTRTLKCILDMILSSPLLIPFLSAIKARTTPYNHNVAAQWGDSPANWSFTGANAPLPEVAKNDALFSKYAREILDEYIKSIGEQSVKDWAREHIAPIDEE